MRSTRWRPLLLALALSCLLASAAAQPSDEPAPADEAAGYADEAYDEYEGVDDDEAESGGGGGGGVRGGFMLGSQRWREFTGRLQRSVDAESLLRARRLANAANGALLVATGPIAFAVSVLGLRLSNVLLSLYVTAFGGVLAGVELGLAPIAPWVNDNMSYLHTTRGRTALIAFLGGLTWPLGRLGLVPGILTAINALFNANFAKLLAFVEQDDEPRKPGGSSAFEMPDTSAGGGRDEVFEAAQAMAEAAEAQAQAQAGYDADSSLE